MIHFLIEAGRSGSREVDQHESAAALREIADIVAAGGFSGYWRNIGPVKFIVMGKPDPCPTCGARSHTPPCPYLRAEFDLSDRTEAIL
jgi:hypothetical protein